MIEAEKEELFPFFLISIITLNVRLCVQSRQSELVKLGRFVGKFLQIVRLFLNKMTVRLLVIADTQPIHENTIFIDSPLKNYRFISWWDLVRNGDNSISPYKSLF
jgi:uncharacterized membrane protein